MNKRIKTKFLWRKTTLPIYSIHQVSFSDMKHETHWLKVVDVYQEYKADQWVSLAFIDYNKLKDELEII
jgi:hypothetical protein